MSRLARLTDEQRAVVTDLGANYCVTSGAGCGKTRVLVERYVQFLEEDLDLALERLAAITFTEMAAAEMRDRIRRTCRERAAESAGDLSCVAKRGFAKQDARAARIWTARYWGVDTAPIDTIHAFCAGILRRWPIEAGIDPNFAMLDEAEAALLQDDVVRRIVETLLEAEDADLLALLEHVDLMAARDMLGEIVREKREVLRRVAAPVLARGDDEVLAGLKQAADDETLALLRRAADAPAVREAARALATRAGRAGDARELLRARAVEEVGRLRDARTAQVALAAADWLATGINLTRGSASAWSSPDDLEAVKGALRTVRDAMKKALERVPRFDEATERAHLALARALGRTAGRVGDAYDAAKAEASALDFEDLQVRARDLLRADPRVLAACRARYRAILVDELQDTNLLQYEIVDLLATGGAGRRAAAGPAGAQGAALRPGAFFAVGDPKQSIYRFRGAEVEVFQAARRRVGPRGRRGLRASFRLNPGTAALVNRLFAPRMGDLYEPVEGLRAPHNDAVGELHVIQKPPGTDALVEDAVIAEARVLAARIDEIVRTGAVAVQDDGAAAPRPARFGDIAILLRRMSNLHLYEEALEHQGVPYYVVAGHGFYKQQEVLDVLHLLRALDDPSDDLHVAGVLRSPFFAASDEALWRLRRLGPSLFDALARAAEADHLDPEDLRALARAERLLPAWAAAKDRMGLAALVEHVVFDSGYAAGAVGRFGGARAYANLRQMAELARRFERRGLFGLGDYIDYVSDFMRGEMRAEQAPVQTVGGDTVRLMTIHKAKGLEFPVVAVPDLSYMPQNRAPRYAIHPAGGLAVRMRDEEGDRVDSCALALARADADEAERQESYRLLYVALTRAKDYLVLTLHAGYNRGSAETWGDLLQGLGDASDPAGDLPLGGDHIMRRSVCEPPSDRARRGHRRGGPRGVLVGGRVAWDRLREASDGSAARRAAATLDRVRPPAARPRAPTRLAATALDTYRRCPALYCWNHVLGLDAPGPVAPAAPGDLTPRERGNLLHRALERATSPDDAVVRAAAVAAVREAPLAPGFDTAPLADRVAKTVRDFWASDLGRRVAVARRALREVPMLLAIDGTEVAGKMDLLFQRQDGTWELVDYKSGSAGPDAADAYRFQLGLYALAAARWLDRPASGARPSGDRGPIVRASVYFLGSGEALARDLSADDLDRAEADARRALAGIAAGRFDPLLVAACARCRFVRPCGTSSIPSQPRWEG
jgi:ATP-dependent helicase/nuclease subunit A